MTAPLLVGLLVCTIRGYLYADGLAPVELTREDHCPVAVVFRNDTQLMLQAGTRLVLIRVPEQFLRAGHVAFWYPWDSPRAYFAGQAYPVVRADAPVG